MVHRPYSGFRPELPSRPCPSLSRATHRDGGARALLALTACIATLPAHAGRPLASDDAAVVDRGACQLETWIGLTRSDRGIWLNPSCNPFGNTEFALGGGHVREDGGRDYTLVQWQFKQLLRAYTDTQAGFAVAFGGEHVRGDDARTTFINGIATLPLAGQAQLLHLNLGASLARDASSRLTRAAWGLAYDAEVAASTRVAAEGFGVSGERANWQLGVRHELVPGHVQIDASVGGAFGRWSDTRVVTAGLVLVSPAFLP